MSRSAVWAELSSSPRWHLSPLLSTFKSLTPTATWFGRNSGSGPMSTIRRDYRELVPLLRHRYQPDDPAVAALRRRSHDVRLTIDAGLQIRVAAIIEAHANKASGKAAAVVLDPDTGAVLASVSYP